MTADGRRYRVRWVDVFTERPLLGNPLAVVLAADGLSDAQMQAIARETNLSETTFVLPPEKREHAAKVRIFTPHVELPFAGHPTVGTGLVLIDEGLVGSDAPAFTLEEGVGPIAVRVDRAARSVLLWMSHPPVTFGEVIEEREEMAAALGLRASDLQPNVPMQVASTGVPFLYVALKNAASVDRAVSRGDALTAVLDPHGLPPVFLFAAVGPKRLYSRMFGPHGATRIAEDPATGSARGTLGAHFVRDGGGPRAALDARVCVAGARKGWANVLHI